ncbi:MAG: DUF159 family protein [Alphaproteobacteria bacterium 64-11]|jgi:putative SOS response-associated peptidase YedK|nr:MAG: DUF159 family protein [Alphaproteobacteria bacterium 64-11]
MCNLYSLTKGPQAILDLTRTMRNGAGNLAPQTGIFPDYAAPIVRTGADGVRELVMARWGMPCPPQYAGPPVTNIRNVKSPHWRRWLGVGSRCVVPATSFCEYEDTKPRKTPIWFALAEDRPLFVFAGVWTPWRGVRKKSEGEMDHEIFGFLTCEANAVVRPIHEKAMPVILTTPEETEAWMTAPAEEALTLQRPLPEEMLKIVARGERYDGPKELA